MLLKCCQHLSRQHIACCNHKSEACMYLDNGFLSEGMGNISCSVMRLQAGKCNANAIQASISQEKVAFSGRPCEIRHSCCAAIA